MGLLSKFFGGKGKEETGTDVAGKIVALFEERTAVDSLRLCLTRETCAPWESKLGGVPYLPEGFAYPLERGEGRETVPLRFLAQLNFAEMPALEGFPSRGILQFYTGNDEQHGVDYETMTAQKAFRVIFHEEVTTYDTPRAIPETPEGEAPVPPPFEGESRIRFERERSVMNAEDFRFDALLLQYYNEVNPGARVRSLERVPERLLDGVYEHFSRGGHRVGGYPAFAGLDPRLYHDHLHEHTVLLLQVELAAADACPVAWNGTGSWHFFIRPDDLAASDFAEVSYSLDSADGE
jgi:uncharacterized protein YwqG